MTADFWFDPMCPYAWITSRWLVEVITVRPVTVRWAVMSLSVLNEHREDDPEGDPEGYLWVPVRICAAVHEKYGDEALGRYYAAVGARVHERGQWDAAALSEALEDAGLPRELAAVGSSTDYDEAVRQSHADAVRALGSPAGTPVTSVDPGDGTRIAFHGPVLSAAPRSENAGRLWDATLTVAATPGFHGLKGSPTRPPEPGGRA